MEQSEVLGAVRRPGIGARCRVATFIIAISFGIIAPEPATEEHSEKKGEVPGNTWGVLPALSFDSDVGFGFGAFGGVIRHVPPEKSFLWELTAQVKMTMKRTGGGVTFPVHDHFITFDSGKLLQSQRRFFLSLFYFRQVDVPYYGLGNNSVVDPDESFRTFVYKQESPGAVLQLKQDLRPQLPAFVTVRFRYDKTKSSDSSKLHQDRNDTLADEFEEIEWRGSTFIGEIEAGLGYDSRDNEIDPVRGVYGEFSLRGTPAFLWGKPYSFGGFNLTGLGFKSLREESITLAARLTFDSYFGRVPFHRLTGTGGRNSRGNIWGAYGVRGVPSGRFHGKTKVLGNLESRFRFGEFKLLDNTVETGAGVFWDFGRVWVDLARRSPMDGDGVGLKHGTGGGVRLLVNDVLLLRFDCAYSKQLSRLNRDSVPLSLYFVTDHVF